jgi:hypothetical protein
MIARMRIAFVLDSPSLSPRGSQHQVTARQLVKSAPCHITIAGDVHKARGTKGRNKLFATPGIEPSRMHVLSPRFFPFALQGDHVESQ